MVIDSEDAPLFAETASWEAVQQRLEEIGIGDGLPLVPPTTRRLELMLVS